MRGLKSMRGKRKPISLRGWLFHYNPVRYTTDFILPTARRFQFTLPTLRTETQHPDSECLSCEVYTRFCLAWMETHRASFIGMICVVEEIERGW